MTRMKKMVLGAVVSLGLLVGVMGIAYAADPTPTPPANAPRGWQGGPSAGPRGAMPGSGPGFGAQPMHEALTNLLGMTAQEIQDAHLNGQSLAQIAASKGVSKDKLVETLMAGRKEALDARVKAGNLTQAQADAALKAMQESVTAMVDRTEVGPAAGERGRGFGPGRGMMGPGGCGMAPGTQQGPNAPQGQPGQGRGRGPGMMGRWGGQAPSTN